LNALILGLLNVRARANIAHEVVFFARKRAMTDRIRLTERDFRLLGIFRVVAEAGGVTAAEERLGMERSTISRSLQALEGRVGGTLCSRGLTGFKLTELGEKVFRASLAARDAILRAEDKLAESMGTLTGELMLGIADYTITNPECRIAEAINQFHVVAPAVETHLSIRPPPELIVDVLMRRLEFAIVAVPSARFKLASLPLFDEDFRLFVRQSETEGVQLKQLAAKGFAIVMREDNWQSEALAAELGLAQRGVGRGLEAVAILVASGGYVGFLPTHMIGALMPPYPLAEVQGAEQLRYTKTFALVYDPARPFSAAGAVFEPIVRNIHGNRSPMPSND
jgi:LysR family transcriptional regulator, transcriptional activator for bauABCD operon